MSIATEILSLRRNRSSSVELLLGAIEWARKAPVEYVVETRMFAALEAADLVLLNTAAHAADTLNEPPTTQSSRRATMPSRRRRRRYDSGSSFHEQCRLFA
jgi:hypothetical protein